MYLEKMVLKNLGPISKLDLQLEFTEEGNPKPLILVGENGSGKSFSISSVVDSFYEFSKQAYNDITRPSIEGSYYFKTITSNSIKIEEKYYYAYLKFKDSEKQKKLLYIDKSGEISKDIIEKEIKENIDIREYREKENFKWTTQDKKYFEEEFYKNSYCFFPPFRYELPFWLNENSIGSEKFKFFDRVSGKLDKPILISNILEINKEWFLDIILDSRVDIIYNGGEGYSAESNLADAKYLRKARTNIEKVLSKIIGKDIKFQINYRNDKKSRFSLLEKGAQKMYVHSLEGLSTGQLALLNIFSTIVRYSDFADIKKGIELEEIKGIVIIEEIDLHLHSIILRTILPELIKLFPKIQFIITTHSPLFLLGMEEKFGENGIMIIDLPNGDKINSERFSQFQKSFDYYEQTIKYSNEIKKELDKKLKGLNKPLIITEGKTDWKHYKKALEYFKSIKKFEQIEVDFLEYGEELKMSSSALNKYLKNASKIKSINKIICLFDSDDTNGNCNIEGEKYYKDYGNNYFGMCIKTPEHRKPQKKGISVELLYKDKDLKRKDEKGRRLYLSNEFNENGRLEENPDINYLYLNTIKENLKKENQKIIDSDIKNSNGKSLALSKNEFALKICNGEFSEIDFCGFESVFETINEILNKYKI